MRVPAAEIRPKVSAVLQGGQWVYSFNLGWTSSITHVAEGAFGLLVARWILRPGGAERTRVKVTATSVYEARHGSAKGEFAHGTDEARDYAENVGQDLRPGGDAKPPLHTGECIDIL